MAKRILITGGNGYVGRELARMLYDEHELCVADIVRYGQVRFREDELKKLRFERVDVRDAVSIGALISEFKPDAIVHLAAIHYIPECEQDPRLAVATNVNGTLNLLLAAPVASRFIFASSGAVYRPDDQPHNEASAALAPSDIYGFTKLHGEHFVRYLAQQKPLSAVVVRLFNVVGPGETNPHLLPEVVAQLKAGLKTIRLGNTWPKRDYIHVLDAARGFLATALNSEIGSGQTVTVNLGTSRSYSVAEVVAKLRAVSQIDFKLEEDVGRLRKVDRPFLAADIGEIKRRFDWEPRHSINDALADLWRDPDMATALTAKYQI